MKDRSESDEHPLPPELAELDAELSSIAWEERPSFGPELEAELEREWARVRNRPHVPVRQLMAAGVAGLLMVGLGVPSARGALVRLLESLQGAEPPAEVLRPPEGGAPLFFEMPAPEIGGDEPYSGAPAIPATPPPAPEPTPLSSYAGPEATLPLLHDRDRLQAVIAENYPRDLQDAGVGGTVRLLLWVDSAGSVDFVNLGQSSGEPALDQAALEVAPTFRFEPARRWGQPVGTWVEFDMVFEPRPPEERPEDALPDVVPADRPDEPPMEVPVVSSWRGSVALPAPVQREAGDLLRAALDDEELVGRLGPIDAILQGNPPPGTPPTAWRGAVADALEGAMVRDPDNPAPLLALARLRRKQGLPDEARALVERGIRRADGRAESVSPSLRAELHYERGRLLKERWAALRGVGWVPADSLSSSGCPAARSAPEGEGSDRASVERLIAWNYLCPAGLDAVMEGAFRSDTAAEASARREMLASFRAAVAAHPAHAGANVELLLTLAEEGRWSALVDGARRFAWASQGHPHALLLAGLALQRLGRSAEAEAQFSEALQALPAEEAEALRDVRGLIPDDDAAAWARTSGEEREAWRADFWRPLDPIRATEVNEREMEHLARATYAQLALGGLDTDAGRIWVRYGAPDAVRVFQEGAGLRTEFWDYGPGPDLTFRRMTSSGAGALTSEGRAYVDDLRDVYPHRYGPLGRDVLAATGEVTRFRGAEAGTTDLEIRAPFPSALASDGEDGVEASVFLLDDRGHTLARARRPVSRADETVLFRVPAPAEAVRVVVEFRDPRSGRTAALGEAVALTDVDGEGPGISDLLLTEPATPDRDAVRRDASWIRPLGSGEALQGPTLGAFFELYGMREATSWYRIHAEVERLDDGVRSGVPVRPAGEDGYRATWDRLADASGTRGEFVGLDLDGLSPGRYNLCVVVDFPLAGGPLLAERLITVR